MAATRREVLTALSALGVGSLTFQRALAANLQPEAAKSVTAEMVKQAEWIAGITLTDADRTLVAAGLSQRLAGLNAARSQELPNDLGPALHFAANPGQSPPSGARGIVTAPECDARKPDNDLDLAFAPVHVLAHLIQTKQVSSTELTKFFLARLRKYDPTLKCVVNYTEELATAQAKRADEELAAGKYRGPLHGIPWCAKDLINIPGYPTTWGCEHFKTQTFEGMATVAEKLTEAGAVCIAKTTLGALAMGDVWFGGTTKNPWNPKQGSSGSSAGSASAVAAGCVPFAIGTETHGSIISPSRRCGVTGLRPTFGRVSRAGCMALAWSMDKVGPMARCVDDCALIFSVIHGSDPADPTAQDRPFDWPGGKKLADLRVGYFEKSNKTVLAVLRRLGVKLVPVKLPDFAPYRSLNSIITCEAAAAFEALTRKGVREGIGAWATTFRQGQLISAVDYIRMQRLRSRLMEEMAKAVEAVDLYAGGDDLLTTNLTGHPCICLPNGFTKAAGLEVPAALTFTGRLFDESDLLTVAKAYQDATGHHHQRPAMNFQ